MTNETEKQDVTTVFWTNVEWHLFNKGMAWSGIFGEKGHLYRGKQRNITLKTVQKIASILDIDDYAILFEEIPESREVSK